MYGIIDMVGFYMDLPFAVQAKFLSKEGWLAKTGGNNKVYNFNNYACE